MTQLLRDELARIADGTPPVLVAADTWSRGRRARRRDRIVTSAVCLLIACGGLGALVITPTEMLPTNSPADSRPGVPDRLPAVPEWLVQFPDSDTREVVWAPELDVVSDLAVGRAAAAFAVGEYGRLPVVVTAMDGRHLPLDLPGFADAGSINHPGGEGSALALSPDGAWLAYAWWDPTASLEAPMPAGVRVVDLTTGDITTTELEGGNGIDVDLLAWSPSGDWLAWYGQETQTWTPMSKGGRGDVVAGRIRLGSTTSEPVPITHADDTTIAISDEGHVAFWNGRSVTRGDRRTRIAGAGSGWWGPGRFAPASDLLALSDGSVGTLPLLDVSTGDVTYEPLPPETPAGTQVRSFGWTPDGRVVATHWTTDEEPEAVLAMVDPGEGEWVSVGRVAPELLGSLTLASDLMTSEQRTIDRPAPDWPWSVERRAAVFALSAAGLLFAAVLLRRRRFRTSPRG